HPVVTWRAHALRDRSKPGSLWIRPTGALYTSPLPPGSTWSSRYPTPGDALAMLAAADAGRPAGHSGQFGRFTGIDYSDRPSVRAPARRCAAAVAVRAPAVRTSAVRSLAVRTPAVRSRTARAGVVRPTALRTAGALSPRGAGVSRRSPPPPQTCIECIW